MMNETRRFSQSEMKTFLRCRRKWYLSEYRRLAPIGYDPTGPLRSGSRVHTALEAFYTPGQDAFEALEAAQRDDWNEYCRNLETMSIEADPSLIEIFAKECQLERIMLEGYGEWVAESGVDEGLTLISTEEIITVPGYTFASEIENRFGDFDVVGKLDARLRRDRDGARLFEDHKTAISLTRALPMLAQDPQMLHYHWLEAMTTPEGERCDGALYNVLKKVKRTKAAKPPFYARYEVQHNQAEIDAYEFRMREIIRQIFEMEEQLSVTPLELQPQVAYLTKTQDCSWDCPFNAVCPMFDDGSRAEDMLKAQFAERDPLARYAEGGESPTV